MSLQPNQPLADLAADAKAHLRHFYDKEATLVAAAPGRVNLIGEHIDYCDGFVLPLAIERYILIAAAPNGTVMNSTSPDRTSVRRSLRVMAIA